MFVSGIAPDTPGSARCGGSRSGTGCASRWRSASSGRAVAAVEAAGGRVLSVQPVRQTLEDYFFREMGAATGGAASWGEG